MTAKSTATESAKAYLEYGGTMAMADGVITALLADRDRLVEALREATADYLRHNALLPSWSVDSSDALARIEARAVRAEAVIEDLVSAVDAVCDWDAVRAELPDHARSTLELALQRGRP